MSIIDLFIFFLFKYIFDYLSIYQYFSIYLNIIYIPNYSSHKYLFMKNLYNYSSSVFLYIYLSIYLSIYLYIYLSIYLGCRAEEGVPDMTRISDMDENGINKNLEVIRFLDEGGEHLDKRHFIRLPNTLTPAAWSRI